MTLYIELTSPLGARQVVPVAAYIEIPAEALRGTRARLMTRDQVIRARVEARSERSGT